MAESEVLEIPKFPTGLKTRGQQIWTEIHQVFDFSEAPDKQIILEEACRTADVVKRLQTVVDKASGLRVNGSQGQPVAMPEIPELRQYRALLTSLMKALALPDEDEGWSRSKLGKAGAAARWGNRG